MALLRAKTKFSIVKKHSQNGVGPDVFSLGKIGRMRPAISADSLQTTI